MATPRTKKAVEPTPAAPVKESSAANRRYTEASRRLREKYSEEFYDILAAVWKEDGAEYKPRLSPADRARVKEFERKEKAKAKLEALYTEFPDLRPADENEVQGLRGALALDPYDA